MRIQQAASRLRALGFALCKPNAGTKNPTDKGWSTRSLEAIDFAEDDLIGILAGPLSPCGKPGHSLVVIDLDDEDAVNLADEYLPATALAEGRVSKPRSHRYYLVPNETIPEWAISPAEKGAPAAIKATGHAGPFKKGFDHRETGKRILDWIATGGQVVAPPSSHTSGELREWDEGEPGTPTVVTFLELWDAVCRLASRCGAKMPTVGTTRIASRVSASPSVEARAAKYLAKIPGAVSGQGGHNATFAAARAMVWGFDLQPETALRLMAEGFNPRCSPPWSEQELRHKVEDADRVDFGKPRGWLKDADRISVPAIRNNDVASVHCHVEQDDPSPTLKLTDIGNARRFVADCGKEVRYVADMGQWFVWCGNRWKLDRSETQIERLAKETINRMAHEAAIKVGEAAKAIAEAGDDETQSEKLKTAMKAAQAELAHAKKSADHRAVRRMLQAARSESAICVPVGSDVFDAKPDLLNCVNGTIELKTGTLREHRRGDHITKLCPTAYRKDASRSTYLTFLETIFDGKPRVAQYIRDLSGYALTGHVTDQTMTFLHGVGANGKTVLVDSWIHVLGESEYAHTAAAELLVNDGGDRHPTERTGLRGSRLVICSETGEDGQLDETKMKGLTGGDTVTARYMRGDFFQFKPTHKLILLTNNLPKIRGTDHGVRRRLRLVPFGVKFWKDSDRDLDPEGDYQDRFQADPTLSQRLRETEAEGILADMVQHAVKYYQGDGTIPAPPEVTGATASYIADQDVIGQFFAARVVADDSGRIKAADLYSIFKKWWEAEGHPVNRVPGVRKFGIEAGRKYVRSKSSSATYAVRVLPEDQGEQGSITPVLGVIARAHAHTSELTPEMTPILPYSHSDDDQYELAYGDYRPFEPIPD